MKLMKVGIFIMTVTCILWAAIAGIINNYEIKKANRYNNIESCLKKFDAKFKKGNDYEKLAWEMDQCFEEGR